MVWVAWAATSLAFNIANTVNSRAKQSRSWKWNAWSSFVVGVLYIGSMVGIGNEILKGTHRAIALAVLVYGLSSALGSVIGQEIVLQTRFFQRIERGRNGS